MKKNLLILSLNLAMLAGFEASGQWCMPTTVIPYNANMPGITHVIFNTIDRISADLENMSNSYIVTGLSTNVVRGQSYDISITYTIDATICPDMNLRVWIDFNQDGQLDDIGETVISVDHQSPGTYLGNFTIPANATLGTTRMRVTAKMTSLGGHSLPTPCDQPADPLGYHGEMEDYELIIMDATGINALSATSSFFAASRNGNINYSFSVLSPSLINIELLDISGRTVANMLKSSRFDAGEYAFDFNASSMALTPGIYFVAFDCDNKRTVKQVVYQQ